MNVTFRFCFRSPLKSLKLPVFKGLSTDLGSHSFLHISFYPLYKFQDVTAMLKAYSSYVSLAAISRETGINSALLSHYANGLKVPRNKQQKIIVSGLHRIGALLSKCTIDDERKTQLNIERK